MIHMPSLGMWLIIAMLGLLFFGKRLPEVGRSLGKGIVEFKKGLHGIEEEVAAAVDEKHPAAGAAQQSALPGQKFDPYTGKPLANPEYKFDPYTGKPLQAQLAENTETVPPESR